MSGVTIDGKTLATSKQVKSSIDTLSIGFGTFGALSLDMNTAKQATETMAIKFNALNGKVIEPCPATERSIGIAQVHVPVRKLAQATLERVSNIEGIVEINYPGANIFSCFRVAVGRQGNLYESAYVLAEARAKEHGYELAQFAA